MILLYDLVGADEAKPFSGHCWKVKMALAHKGLAYRSVPTTFLQIPDIEGGISKTLPVIRDGDKVIADSFEIALYLDKAYPDRPTLFGGTGGEAVSRLVERWSLTQLHPALAGGALLDIHAALDDVNKAFFRDSREKRFGKTLEEAASDPEHFVALFRARLEPLKSMLGVQPFIGGQSPLFADYIVFGALQWVRIVSPRQFVDDPEISAWFERCLGLFDGLGRNVPAAA